MEQRFNYQWSNNGRWWTTVAVGLTFIDCRKIAEKAPTRGYRRFVKETV